MTTTTATLPAPTGTSRTNHYPVAPRFYTRCEIEGKALRVAGRLGGTLVDLNQENEDENWEAVITVWSA